MSYPPGIITRPVTFGPAFELEDGSTAGMTVTFKATRPGLLWRATGQPAVSVAITRSANDGLEQTVDLPVTNQTGWGDGDGNALVPGTNGHVFLYAVEVTYTRAGRAIPNMKPRTKNVPIPAGSGPLDLDDLVPLTTPGGSMVSVPDLWSAQVAAAQEAAAAAEAAVLDVYSKTAADARYPLKSAIRHLVTVDDLPATGLIVAHGGSRRNGRPMAPEATRSSYQQALALGAHILDIDYRRTRDGVLVGCHDDTTANVSDVTVTIGATAYRDLPKITMPKLLGTGWPAEPFLSIEDFFFEFGGRAVLQVEIKDGLPDVAPITALVKKYGLERSVLLLTGNPTVTAAITAAGCLAYQFNNNTTSLVDGAAAGGAWMVEVPLDANTAFVDYVLSKGFPRAITGAIKMDGTSSVVDSYTKLNAIDARISSVGVLSDAMGYVPRPGGASTPSSDSIAGAVRTGKRGAGWKIVNSSNIPDWLIPGRLYLYKAGAVVATFGDLSRTIPPAGTLLVEPIFDTLPTTLTQSQRTKLFSPEEDPVNPSANTTEGYILYVEAGGARALNSIPVGGGSPASVFNALQGNPIVAGVSSPMALDWNDTATVATLSAAVAAGTVTSLPVNALVTALPTSSKLLLPDGTQVTTSATAAVGATSIPVASVAVPALASGAVLRLSSGWVTEGNRAVWRGRHFSVFSNLTDGVVAIRDLAIS